MARHITPKQKEEVIALRLAGYTHAAIADKVDISLSSAKRLTAAHSVKRGELKQELIDKAKDELLNDASAVDNIKREAYSLLIDDIAMVKRLREVMAEATEKLKASDITEALQVMRAVSAGAVALKSTSETLRKSLGMDKDDEVSGDLPEIVISVLTEEEMENIRIQSTNLSTGIGHDTGDVLDSEENDVIIEGMDEPEVTSV